MFSLLPLALWRFSRQGMNLAQARDLVHQRMAQREENFLRSVESSIYAFPRSPYLALLRAAGCEFGDLAALVKSRGLEGALRQLREEGVYVTFEEFKGRRPIERPGLTLPVTARDFDNPAVPPVFVVESGGSSGLAINVGVNLEQVQSRAPDELVTLSAHNLLDAPALRWTSILPTGSLRHILRAVYIGHAPQRWFSPLGLRDSRYWRRYALATYYTVFWARACGMPVPWPEYVRVQQAITIAKCACELLRSQGSCLVHCNPSRAMRVCLAAQEAELDLRGLAFHGSEEALTPAKLAFFEGAGVRFVSNYGGVESGRIGAACARPSEAGDVHLLRDAVALFSHPFTVENLGITVPAFNVTSLLPAASKVMLNVQIDDYGIVEERHCGCELEQYGYTTHLRQIRSYAKLTGEGVTLIGTEMVRILEEVLPARFGGTPLDYQVLEEEDEQGFTRLYVLIDPRIQLPDDQTVVSVILSALSESSPTGDATRRVWEQMKTIRIRRTVPLLTARGKLLPLHSSRPPRNPPS
jgi:hypothetical protein